MQSAASVAVIVVADSELALLPLGESWIVSVAVSRARAASCKPQVVVWIGPELRSTFTKVLQKKLLPDTQCFDGESLYDCARSLSSNIVLVHDSQRPLTLSSTFDRVAEALSGNVQCSRPAHVVVDTLKTVNQDFVITGTVNRDLVQSLTSPEGFLRSALSDSTPPRGWSLAVQDFNSCEYVRGDQESLRVREKEDVLLVESFLAWQTVNN